MKTGCKQVSACGLRLRGVNPVAVLLMLAGVFVQSAGAQTPYMTEAGEMILFQSAGASSVVEKVTSSAQGVMFEVFVKKGESVRKGQILGHLELDATKLQLDLARQTMDAKANVDAARSQAAAWTATREETEVAVRKRGAEESRLEWALAMEEMYHSNYKAQLDAEETQRIQYQYWKQQYENRFFRASVDGIVSEVLVEAGKPVNYGTHLFTVSNENTILLPVTVPAQLAGAEISKGTIPVRSADGKSVSKAHVDSVVDDPQSAGRKIVKLLIKVADLSEATRSNLMGMKFDVLLPSMAQQSGQ